MRFYDAEIQRTLPTLRPMLTTINILALLLTGLITGLFYAYDFSVVGGLGQLDDRAYLSAFQSINRVIQNPAFFTSFMGTLVVLPLATYMNYKVISMPAFYLMLAAALVYIIGVFGVTMFGNVPLNNALDAFDITTATDASMKQMRSQFEGPWNMLNHIRTFSCVVSFVLLIVSKVKF